MLISAPRPCCFSPGLSYRGWPDSSLSSLSIFHFSNVSSAVVSAEIRRHFSETTSPSMRVRFRFFLDLFVVHIVNVREISGKRFVEWDEWKLLLATTNSIIDGNKNFILLLFSEIFEFSTAIRIFSLMHSNRILVYRTILKIGTKNLSNNSRKQVHVRNEIFFKSKIRKREAIIRTEESD